MLDKIGNTRSAGQFYQTTFNNVHVSTYYSKFGVGTQNLLLALLFAILVFPHATSAQTLIRCPDWKSLVNHATPVILAKGAPKTSFEQAVKRAGTPNTQGAVVSDAARIKTTALPNPNAPAAPSCPTYTVKRGDTLGSIAQAQMGSSKKHAQLLAANKSVVPSAKTLKIGTVLTVPCKPVVATTVVAVAKPKSKGLFANNRNKARAAQPKPKPVVVAAAIAPPKPLPVWNAKSGEYLSDVIKRWGKTAGYKVIVTGHAAWRLGVPVREVGTFKETLERLVKGFATDGRPPSVRVFSNKVIKIGSVL